MQVYLNLIDIHNYQYELISPFCIFFILSGLVVKSCDALELGLSLNSILWPLVFVCPWSPTNSAKPQNGYSGLS